MTLNYFKLSVFFNITSITGSFFLKSSAYWYPEQILHICVACIAYTSPTNCAQSIEFIFSSSYNQPIVPVEWTSRSEYTSSDRNCNTNINVLFSWYFNTCKMLPVKALTTWPRSCFVEITSYFFSSLFRPDCFHKICWRSAILLRLNPRAFSNNL